ncbi:MAG: hypothetical protein JXA93_05475 [Anaerolineae bacterium]|nr:hypothetical protein [Anaerolineae bacterium]
MATDEQKQANLMRLAGLTSMSMALGIWDMVGDGALALCPAMGDQLLGLMEHEMGLEIAGENPSDVIAEIARLLVDEFGIAQHVDQELFEGGGTMTVRGCLAGPICASLIQNGAEPFTCSFRNAGYAALTRAGIKVRPQVTFNQPDGCKVTFRAR